MVLNVCVCVCVVCMYVVKKESLSLYVELWSGMLVFVCIHEGQCGVVAALVKAHTSDRTQGCGAPQT